MIGYILFGATLSIFIAYVVMGELEYGGIRDEDFVERLGRLALSIFWPITVLVWLGQRPALRPMWVFIGKGFAFMGRKIGFVLGPIFRKLAFLLRPVLKPISRPIFALWHRWINRWPEPKRPWIKMCTFWAIFYAFLAILSWLRGDDRMYVIIYWGIAVTALSIILVIYLVVRAKQANSS